MMQLFGVVVVSMYIISIADGKRGFLNDANKQDTNREDTSRSSPGDVNHMWLQRLTDETNHQINSLQEALEPKVTSMGTKVNSLDKKMSNIEHRIHALDNFQAYASAWNSQFSSMESKMDVMNSFQEKLTSMQDKIDSLANLEDTVNQILVKLKFIELMFTTNHGTSDTVSPKVLNTLRVIEKNTDKLLLMKSTTSPAMEDLLNDVSSKVSSLVIKSNQHATLEEPSMEYEMEDPTGISSTNSSVKSDAFAQLLKSTYKHCVNKNNFIEEVLKKATTIENISKLLLEKENYVAEKQLNNDLMILDKLHGAFDQSSRETRSLFHEQNVHFQKFWEDKFTKIKEERNRQPEGQSEVENLPAIPGVPFKVRDLVTPIHVPTKSGCDELDSGYPSGVYVFGNSSDEKAVKDSERRYNHRYCEIRPDGGWTVIQRRDHYGPRLQPFGLPWASYRAGFGSLAADFWWGNEHLHALTSTRDAVLRVEVEDWAGGEAWAEYALFRVLSEGEGYQLLVGGYSGNASDALAYHNGSLFSTRDRKNDEAPACCPCAVSYDGGWWFKSCFKCNLNGQYRKEADTSFIPYRGVQWQDGTKADRPLKRSVMMVKPRSSVSSSTEAMYTDVEYSDLTTTSSLSFAEEP